MPPTSTPSIVVLAGIVPLSTSARRPTAAAPSAKKAHEEGATSSARRPFQLGLAEGERKRPGTRLRR
jgi:hypothetical protein